MRWLLTVNGGEGVWRLRLARILGGRNQVLLAVTKFPVCAVSVRAVTPSTSASPSLYKGGHEFRCDRTLDMLRAPRLCLLVLGCREGRG